MDDLEARIPYGVLVKDLAASIGRAVVHAYAFPVAQRLKLDAP